MSNSMSPILHVGDMVVLQEQKQYEVGDVIQFKRGDVFYLHRIVEETQDGFLTQGDANPIPDFTPVSADEIHGEAIGVFRRLGLPLYQFKTALSDGSHASFTKSVVHSAALHSRHWQNPTMSWTYFNGAGSITFTSPNGVTFLNSGPRTIQSSITSSGLVKILIDGRLTLKDVTNGGFQISTHTCLSVLSRQTCGWVIQVDDTAKMIKLRTFQSDGTLSSIVASNSYVSSLNQNRKFVFEVSPTRIFAKIDSEVILNVANPSALASSVNALIPSGTRIFVYFNGDNRFNANKLVIW